MKSTYEQFAETPANRRLLEQELLLVSATELICELMQKKNVSRADLAKRIGKSKAFITQVLRGTRNMTLRTLADLAWALESRVQMGCDGCLEMEISVSPGATKAPKARG